MSINRLLFIAGLLAIGACAAESTGICDVCAIELGTLPGHIVTNDTIQP